MFKSKSYLTRRGILIVLISVAAVGCGNDSFRDLAYNTVTSTGRTLFDLWLTELVNNIAGGGEEPVDNENDNTGGNENDNTSENENTGGGFDDLTGDVDNGMTLFSTNCASCHCPDASGGCLLDAPAIVGASAEDIDEYVRGDATHPAKREWTDQEVVDVEAYLATFVSGGNDNTDTGNDNSSIGNDNSDSGNDNSSGPSGDPANGMTLYDTNCSGCHCADATGNCFPGAPAVIDASFELIDDYVRGDATHPVKREWTDQEVLDVEAYLATLGAAGQ